MSTLSPAFKDRIIAVHGKVGRKWLTTLPRLQTELVQRWSLRDIQPVPDLSYNYLVFGTNAEKKPVVLKIGVPHPELEAEIQALQIFDGSGAVQLLDADPSLGALLLERITPGDDLRAIENDGEATRIAARVMKELWRTNSNNPIFSTAADWCQGFQRYLNKPAENNPLPLHLVLQASKLADDLLTSPHDQYLLHGDMHHMNILKTEADTWIAIDPKGVIGEPAFEVGAFLLNPVPDLIHWPDLKEIQKQRLIILEEELIIDRERLTGWSFVRAVLSAIWSHEDGEDWSYGIKVAEVLRDLI